MTKTSKPNAAAQRLFRAAGGRGVKLHLGPVDGRQWVANAWAARPVLEDAALEYLRTVSDDWDGHVASRATFYVGGVTKAPELTNVDGPDVERVVRPMLEAPTVPARWANDEDGLPFAKLPPEHAGNAAWLVLSDGRAVAVLRTAVELVTCDADRLEVGVLPNGCPFVKGFRGHLLTGVALGLTRPGVLEADETGAVPVTTGGDDGDELPPVELMPEALVTWLRKLVHEPKRRFADELARALLTGTDEPARTGAAWEVKAERKVRALVARVQVTPAA